ncbi:hypothetical protein QYF36_018435 [Acer negundo]|nr:hypothetical protein QYF36_018435 [Acer negundo]
MAFSAIFRKSAYSLVPTASRLARANKNFCSAVFYTSSHLNRKPSLGSFVPGFEFSSATETKNCSFNESLLQAIESEFKRIGHMDEDRTSNDGGRWRPGNDGRQIWTTMDESARGLVRLVEECRRPEANTLVHLNG